MRQVGMGAIRAAALALLLLAGLPVLAAAEPGPDQPTPPTKRWSISVGLSGVSGGPAPQLEGAMRGAGFDEPSLSAGDFLALLFCLFCDPSGFNGSNANPASSGTRHAMEYEVAYRQSDRFALGGVLHRSDLGRTRGYQSPHILFVDSATTVLAPMAYLRLGDRVRFGAGPLAAWTEVTSTDSWGLAPATSASTRKALTGGALVSATVETRPRGRLYLALNASHRWIVPVTVGPFTSGDARSSASVPAVRARFGHSSLGISLGVRF